MNTYLILKSLHILSSVLLVGTGFGSAFYLFYVNRVGSVDAIATVSRLVVRADWWFTTPAGFIQPITGLAMMYMAGFTPDQWWLQVTIALYLFAGACWLPVVWLQIKMHAMAQQAAAEKTELPQLYWRYARRWEWLGYPAFLAMVGIYFMMVMKPQ